MTSHSTAGRITSQTSRSLIAVACLLVGLSTGVRADGESIYSENCGSCHNGGFKGMMARAPKIGKDSAWKKRFANGLEQTQSGVLSGTDKHKAMGTEAGLSAEQINEAIAYILSKTNVPGL